MASVNILCKSRDFSTFVLCIFLQFLLFSAQPVQNLCKKLWVSLWVTCGKILSFLWKVIFYTILFGKLWVFHDIVEKFSLWFYTKINRGKVVVLHNFHNPYYYYY